MIGKRPCSGASSRDTYFDRLGADWDRLRESFFPVTVREKALDAARVEPGGLAVDVGAGTGFVTEGLVARGLRVIAVDGSRAMLDALRRKFPDEQTVDCRLGDAAALPLDDATAGVCIANMLLHHVEKPAIAIREMARIVRPGGRVVVTDLDRHTHEFLRDEHHDRWLGFERRSVRRWFSDAGLTGIGVETLGLSCCATSCEGRGAAVIGIFLAIGTVSRSGNQPAPGTA